MTRERCQTALRSALLLRIVDLAFEQPVMSVSGIAEALGVTYAGAYQEVVAPRVREMESQRFEKEKKDFAAEAVRDALSRAGANPASTASTPGFQSNFFDRPADGVAKSSMNEQELVALWADSAPGNSSRAA